MSIYIGNSEIKGIYVGTTPVKEVYVGTTKVRPGYKTYTIVWQETNVPGGFFVQYLDDAAGLTKGSTEFDKFFGYYGCRLSNAGAETATVSQSSPGTLDITQLGTLSSGDNVMIAFPRRGIKMTKSGTQVTLSITDDPNKDGYQYYAHTKGSDAKDTLYLGAYKINAEYKSLSNKSPTYLNKTQFRGMIARTYDSSAGTGRYSQITIYARWYINALYMMKYGNPDSQSVVGKGYTGGSSIRSTGGTNSQTSATYGTSSTTQQVKLFGLEDWWGNQGEFLECCYLNSSTRLTVDNTNSVLQESAYSTDLGKVTSTYIIQIAGSNDGMFKKTNTSGGSDSTYYTDYCYAGANGVFSAGGSYNFGTMAGAFCLYRYSEQTRDPSLGARLMYL